MRSSRTCDRRTALTVGATALASLAGCGTDANDGGESSDGRDSSDTSGPTTTDRSTGTGTPATTDTTSTRDLDLREANVTEVTVESVSGAYRFDVTLYHDDDGEDGYANWWQVETLDGRRLGRRELLHAHSTAPFTRSETVEVPDDVACVVVRGHDQTHGYGGRAMLVSLDDGATRAVDQGAEATSVADADCP